VKWQDKAVELKLDNTDWHSMRWMRIYPRW